VPLGGMLEFTGTVAPNASFVLPFGQAISRTTYAAYFAMVGTAYGAGDGATTFNVVDKRGRLSAGKDDMGGSAASRITSGGSGIAGTTLGAAGGGETVTLAIGNLPAHTHTGTAASDGAHTHLTVGFNSNSAALGATTRIKQGDADYNLNGTNNAAIAGLTTSDGAHTHTFTTDATGSATAVNKMPPTVIVNYILRIL
jgi:microcystin-dependent protein